MCVTMLTLKMMPIRNACSYANMEFNMNKNRHVMMDVRSDVNVKDQVSTTNSEIVGARNVAHNTGVSANCCFKIMSLNTCGLMAKMKYVEFRELLAVSYTHLTLPTMAVV